MKKILIISYFFPPCNLTAAQRAYGWAKHLKQFGYYPIIITRSWEHKIESPEDVLRASGKSIHHIKEDDYEVYYMPYYPGLRDRLFVKLKNSPLQVISKLLTFWNLMSESFTTKFIPHRNLMVQAEKIINSENINKMVISANPFDQFFFGYELNKRTGIKWIADYRDDWSTSELERSSSPIMKIIDRLHCKNEKKWVGTASMITSISPYYTQKISDFTGVKGKTILNGYELPELPDVTPDPNKFTITYNGSLYSSQPIEPFLKAIREIIKEGESSLPIHLNFPGLAFDHTQAKRVAAYFEGIEDHLTITKRIPRNEVLNYQLRSDLLLMISHDNIKGIPSSKLYEYIGLQKPVLLYPNDHDILEETLNDVGLGIIPSEESELKVELLRLISLKVKSGRIDINVNEEHIHSFQRKNQIKELAQILDSLQSE